MWQTAITTDIVGSDSNQKNEVERVADSVTDKALSRDLMTTCQPEGDEQGAGQKDEEDTSTVTAHVTDRCLSQDLKMTGRQEGEEEQGGERQGLRNDQVPAHMDTSPDEEVLRGARERVLSPGKIHSTHQVMETQSYVFCCICGSYGKQLRRSQLHVECPRQPRNRYAAIARNKLMLGEEPFGRAWKKVSDPAKLYLAD